MSAIYLVNSQSDSVHQLTASQKALLYGRPHNFVRTANASKTSFTAEEKDLLLQLHNAYRSMVQPPAKNMKELVWDSDLEEYARQHSQACSGGHSARSMVKVWSPIVSERWDLMGENLYWSYGIMYSIFFVPYSVFSVMYALVLETSSRVGCSINQCDRFTDNPYPGPAMFMTCSYDGMYLDTERPYTIGEACSGCDRNTVGSQFANCRNRLCDDATLLGNKRFRKHNHNTILDNHSKTNNDNNILDNHSKTNNNNTILDNHSKTNNNNTILDNHSKTNNDNTILDNHSKTNNDNTILDNHSKTNNDNTILDNRTKTNNDNSILDNHSKTNNDNTILDNYTKTNNDNTILDNRTKTNNDNTILDNHSKTNNDNTILDNRSKTNNNNTILERDS
ncbi:hypothetical protein EGW08_006829 [Elysia chlorotica]|uniref:SCP domain-containing protein n=1 Tax=Elysia chlorotica TaxID=188477 RepID=A0A3S0ZXE7_ELYCH|nr:hypothetical protein EGW08_006829 [Elysia chlorotica]